jgi:hypothetical protein
MAAATIALSLSGCDTNTGTPAARVSCNCATPAVPIPGMRGSTAFAPVATHHRTHRRFAARWDSHSYYWRREFAEVSVQTYGYHSDSHSHYESGGGGHDSGSGVRTGSGWQDGYSRWHAVAGGATRGANADATRLQSWHGYDADCPDRTRR